MNALARKVVHYGILLFAVAGLASGMLAFTYAATKDRIERQKFLEQVRAVQAVFPSAAERDVKERADLLEVARTGSEIVAKVFEIAPGGQPAGYAFLVTPRGYGGPVTMVVGVDANGAVVGLRVSDHRETPGLGSAVIENAGFVGQFRKKTGADPVEIGRDIDAVSGSTITSKALAAGVRAALDAFAKVGGGR